MKILAADDEAFALEELEKAIRKASPEAELTVYGDPEELLKHLEDQTWDVAFLDVEMGSVSGIDVARELKHRNPRINIVFVTGYNKYMEKALRLRVSGYVTKPVTVNAIKEELENLRNPMPPEKDGLVARCFGTFDVFVNGKSLPFERAKTKEMLAYLIDRRGSTVSSGQLRALLWKNASTDENTRSYLAKVQKDLVRTLSQAGVRDVFLSSWGKYSVDPDKISCDYYDYLNNYPEGIRAYNGEYMSQYSWGEMQNEALKKN